MAELHFGQIEADFTILGDATFTVTVRSWWHFDKKWTEMSANMLFDQE